MVTSKTTTHTQQMSSVKGKPIIMPAPPSPKSQDFGSCISHCGSLDKNAQVTSQVMGVIGGGIGGMAGAGLGGQGHGGARQMGSPYGYAGGAGLGGAAGMGLEASMSVKSNLEAAGCLATCVQGGIQDEMKNDLNVIQNLRQHHKSNNHHDKNMF